MRKKRLADGVLQERIYVRSRATQAQPNQLDGSHQPSSSTGFTACSPLRREVQAGLAPGLATRVENQGYLPNSGIKDDDAGTVPHRVAFWGIMERTKGAM